jgi:hypothetical protein
MLVIVRTFLLCVIAPWLIAFVFIINHQGIIGLPFAIAVGVIGIIITRLPSLTKGVITIIYLCLAFFVLVNYSVRIVCDYNPCERNEKGQPLD